MKPFEELIMQQYVLKLNVLIITDSNFVLSPLNRYTKITSWFALI